MLAVKKEDMADEIAPPCRVVQVSCPCHESPSIDKRKSSIGPASSPEN
jgi:hypothetical protein